VCHAPCSTVVIKLLRLPRPRRPHGVICQRQPNDKLCKTKPWNLERKAEKKVWHWTHTQDSCGKIVWGLVAIFLLSAHDKLMIEGPCVFAGKSKVDGTYDKVINCQTVQRSGWGNQGRCVTRAGTYYIHRTITGNLCNFWRGRSQETWPCK